MLLDEAAGPEVEPGCINEVLLGEAPGAVVLPGAPEGVKVDNAVTDGVAAAVLEGPADVDGVGVGATHTLSAHRPDTQSSGISQERVTGHRPHLSPPQSTSVSS